MNWNRGHSRPFQRGVAPRSQERAPFLDWRSPGVVLIRHTTTPGAPGKGGECPRFRFIHTFYRAPVQCWDPRISAACATIGTGMDEALYAGLAQFIVLLLSLSVHESAHAWTADRLGDPTARLLGRVSLNPLVHADLFGTIIFPIVGMLSGFMFGWAKPVPVNVGRLRQPVRDHMI